MVNSLTLYGTSGRAVDIANFYMSCGLSSYNGTNPLASSYTTIDTYIGKLNTTLFQNSKKIKSFLGPKNMTCLTDFQSNVSIWMYTFVTVEVNFIIISTQYVVYIGSMYALQVTAIISNARSIADTLLGCNAVFDIFYYAVDKTLCTDVYAGVFRVWIGKIWQNRTDTLHDTLYNMLSHDWYRLPLMRSSWHNIRFSLHLIYVYLFV